MPKSFTIPDRLKNQILSTIEEHRMIAPGDSVLAAVSGGPDSTALLLILSELRKELNFTLAAAHLNHMLRGNEAFADETFVKAETQKLGLVIHSKQADVNAWAQKNRISLETAGRDLRYAFFDRLARENGYTKTATGHTLDDNAELVLMNLIRGAGPAGLSGIPPVRDNRLIRPLIRTAKTDLLDCLNQNSRTFRTDASNSDPAFLRNRVRNQLIPCLESGYNASMTDGLNRLSRVMRTENHYLDQEAQKAFASCLIHEDADSLVFSRNALEALHPALFFRVIRAGIQQRNCHLNRISLVHIEDIHAFCCRRGPGKSLDLPGRIRIYRTRQELKIKKESRPLRELGKEEKTAGLPAGKGESGCE